jgi:hypothetical protein
MPDDTNSALAEPSTVFLMSAEDGLADTVRPRLDALGADQEKVSAPKDHQYLLPRDTDSIREAILQTGARLLILDPLAAFLDGSVNSWNNQHVRKGSLLFSASG